MNYSRSELDTIIALNDHLENFAPMLAVTMAALRKSSKALDITSLAAKSEDDWATLIKTIPGDTQYPGQYTTGANPVQDYAHNIVYRFTNQYPASAVVSKIGATKIATKDDIVKILGKNTGFNVTTQAAHTWFRVTADPKADNEVTRADLEKVQELQRCIKLTEGAHKLNQVEALMLSGITSAYRIYTMGKYDFWTEMKKYALIDDEINFIICRAKTIYDTVNYLSVQYMRYDSGDAQLPATMRYGSTASTVPMQIPDMEAMFGSFNTCSCSDCQSVYSPAAYFTDLLHWAKSDLVCRDTGISAYNVLTGASRRPDLPFILLNCANTNTVMPYIDLVNELLSVNLLPTPSYTSLQTSGNTSDLMTMPGNRFPVAEALLNTAFFPWVLPYDPAYSESVRYVNELGVPYPDLIKAFDKPADKYNNIVWAKAWLNLNDGEHTLITSDNTADPNFWMKYWGIAAVPASIGPILKNASLQLNELTELLGSAYITNSSSDINNTIAITPPAVDDCDIDKYKFSRAFSPAIADRLLRLLRLKRKCGLSVWELDLAIKNFGPAIDDNFLVNLSSSLAFCAANTIPFTDLMLWYNDNPYHDFVTAAFNPSAYYKNRFMTSLLPADIIAFFDPAVSVNCFTSLISSLTNDDKQKLATVLKIGIADIDILTGYFPFAPGALLDPVNISRYDRYVTFSKVIGIDLAEMVVLFSLITDPLSASVVSAAGIWSFINIWDDYKKLNKKPSDFKAIVLGQGYYGLNNNGQAANADFSVESKALWEEVKDAINTTRTSFPGGYLVTNQPDPLMNPVAPQLEDIVYQQLANKLDIDVAAVKVIIEFYSTSWVTAFISDTSSWVWDAATEGDFTKVYLPLKRISIESNALWRKVKDAIDTTRASFPHGYIVADQPDLAISPNAPHLENIVYQQLANKFDIDVAAAKAIIEFYSISWVTSFIKDTSAWDAVTQGDFTKVYLLLKRISILSQICGLDADGLQAGISIATTTNLVYPIANAFYWLTYDFAIHDLNYFISIKKATAQAAQFGIDQLQYFSNISALRVHTGDFSDTDIQPVANALYALTGANTQLKTISAFEFENTYYRAQSITYDHKNLVAVMETFMSIFDATQTIGADVHTVWGWVWLDWPVSGTNQRAFIVSNKDDLRRILKSRYNTGDAWSNFIVPIQNSFRNSLRDALVAWYIGKKGFKDSNDIYDHFLLDTEMMPCMKTSRIVLAISSVQLLIERALMGLEPQICIEENYKNEWKWRKNYRVWEADRKIFLYPESWIVPSLRSNMSPFFKDAEDTLLQDDITAANCEKAFSGYLTALHDTSRLDIRGTYIDENPDSHVLHVFARTWNPPYTYYYRNRENNIWSPWEKPEVDIDGDHIIPIVFNRRLYLIWPLFIEKEHRTIKRVIDNVEQNAPYYEIKLCYSKLEFGKWTNKKILDGTMYAGQYSGPLMFNNLEKKLGKGIPNWTVTSVPNPDYDQRIWNCWPSPRGGFPDQYAPNGPFKFVWVSGETYRGNLVLDNINFQDYSYVNLDKKSFFFWGDVDKGTGDLTIHCRRDFDPNWELWHLGYEELAYEDCFKISACDEKVEIVIPAGVEPGKTDKRFLSRPFLTLPDGMLLRMGLDRPELESPSEGLFVKKVRSYAAERVQIFGKTNPSYTLTYPHQYKDAMWDSPFFFSDKRHTYFLERKMNKKCVCTELVPPPIIGAKSNDRGKGGKVTNCSYSYTMSGKYTVIPFEHNYSCTMLAEFNRYGIIGLLDSQNANIRRQQIVDNYFPGQYSPISTYINLPYPANQYDFAIGGAYSSYNWEVFFHMVSVIARQLRDNSKFEDAINWLQFVFDPTNTEGTLGIQRVWKIKPFMTDVTNGSIQHMMLLLSSGGLTPDEETKRDEFIAEIEVWRKNPFDPHIIAKSRPRAYMLWTVLEYIGTLTDWGDSLFRQDTMESINEATNLYILAAKLLGDRPKKISKADNNTAVSFNQIGSGLDAFSNTAINMENQMTGATFSANCTCDDDPYHHSSGFSLPNLLFCIPDNPNLLTYWDKIADRLFKIRHCMNIDGQVQDIPLFQPPIDPALLVRAATLGLDIADVLADLAAPSPHYRFSYLLQKATDFCNEVKSLGGQVLAALEKKDAEELSIIRQLHEQNILAASRSIKKMQIDEAKQTLASLEHGKNLIQIRLSDYQNRAYVSSREQQTIDFTHVSEDFMYVEQGANLLSGILNMFPDPYVGFPSNFVKLPGGDKISYASKLIGEASGIIGSIYRNKASMSATYAGYDRRQEDWNLQIKTATEELNQIDVQILGAEIRIAIAEKELDNQDMQIEQSQEIYDWVRSKFTNHDLYSWMSGQLMALHHKAFGLAYDMAKLAQNAFKKEISGDDPQIIQFGNWDSGKKGLLAGDRLSMQLKELESTYMNLNTRDFELTKTISVKLLDPLALVQLIKGGDCSLELPEWLFNLEYADMKLYAMRIKSIAVSLPCITGPQTSTNVKLKMLKSWIGWQHTPSFIDFTNSPPINEEIITSSALNDPAVFEMNLRDERYMPFENRGVVSQWEISLPNQHEFDYSTISDLVLHIRYVAKRAAPVSPTPPAPVHPNMTLLYTHQFMSLRHDFPMEWRRIISNPIPSTGALGQLTAANPAFLPSLTTEYIPYKMRLAGVTIGKIDYPDFKLYYLYKNNDDETLVEEVTTQQIVISNDSKIFIAGNRVEDIWILYKYI